MSDYKATPIGELPKDEKLQRFKDWFKLSTEAEQRQRERERDDLLFQIPENQWDTDAKEQRKGRPMLSISLLRQPMNLVQSQAAQAHLGVELHPVSEDADKELAEVKQGLYARIQRDGMADQARLWAFDRAKQCGRGWYRITTQYDEDSDEPTDQEIVYERILHQEMVRPDPSSQKPDFSDGRFIFVAAYVPGDTFRAIYQDSEYHSDSDFKALVDTDPEWVKLSGEHCDPLVVECFYKVAMKDDPRGRQVVWRAVLSGREILEDAPWLAPQDRPEEGRRYFPIVPVIGTELQPIDGERRWEGMVRPARDGQVAYNFGISQMVEDVSAISKTPVILDPRQIEGYEEVWQNANRKNYPFLPMNLKIDNEIVPPQRLQVDGTKMQLSMLLSQQAQEMVQAATAVYEPSLGEAPSRKDAQSGRAILALQQQTDAGTSGYLENLKAVTLPLDARIVLDMMPVVYDRPGRVTQVLGAEDETRVVMLNAPFIEKDGRPMKAMPGMPGQPQVYDLNRGKYAIVPTVGKPPQTRLERGQEFLAEVIKAVPEIMPYIGDLVFKFRTEPGAHEIADRLKRQIQATFPHILEDGKNPAEDAQAENAALKQQMGMLQQQLQQAMQAIETDRVKVEGAIVQTQIKEEAATARERMKAEIDLQIAQLQARIKGLDTATDKGVKEEAMVHESIENEKDRQHEREMAQFGAAHDVGMAAASGNSMTMRREGGKEGESERSHEASAGRSRTAEPQADGAGE